MSAGVQEATSTFDCKTPDCDGTARGRIGRHAYCDHCQRVRAESRGGRPIRPVPTAGSYEQRAKDATKALAKAGKRLDRAKHAATVAATELRVAQAAWDQALRDLAGAARNGDS